MPDNVASEPIRAQQIRTIGNDIGARSRLAQPLKRCPTLCLMYATALSGEGSDALTSCRSW